MARLRAMTPIDEFRMGVADTLLAVHRDNR